MKHFYVCKNCNAWYCSHRLLNTLVYQYKCTRCQCSTPMEKVYENDNVSSFDVLNELKELSPVPEENLAFKITGSIWQKDASLFKITKVNFDEFCPYLDCNQSLCIKCQNKENVSCFLQNQTNMSIIEIPVGDLVKYQRID